MRKAQNPNPNEVRFIMSPRLRLLEERFRQLERTGARGMTDVGELKAWINAGPFPKMDALPSRVQGLRLDAEQYGEDFAFLLDCMEPKIYPAEHLVGEIYWEIDDVRPPVYQNAGELQEKYAAAEALGGLTYTRTHNCPDMDVIVKNGYDDLLARIRESLKLYTELKNERRARYLRGMEKVCLACIHYIERYAELAERMAEEAVNEERERLSGIARRCRSVAHKAPADFEEAVQAVTFAVLFDHVMGHGNGHGRLDHFLYPIYRRSAAEGTINREAARELLAEMYMKLAAFFFGLGGRGENGEDAVNEMSWIALEAYDLAGVPANLGVMWHRDIDPAFMDYACDVLARHGDATPVFVNYENMYAMERRSGVPHEDAWRVCYSGCQWFAIPGKEYCGHDMNRIDTLTIFERTLQRAAAENAGEFETLYGIFAEELHRTLRAFQEAEAAYDRVRGDSVPEIYGSMLSHGPIERGLDISAPRGVDYQFTSVNVGGIPNVTDSFTAVRKLVFEKKAYTLQQVAEACASDWAGQELMRHRFLSQPKYGNGIDEVDALYVRICDTVLDACEGYINQRGGQPLRPCLYCYMSHVGNANGATPDGRHKGDPYAHGINPQQGASRRGLLPMITSAYAVDMRKFDGGSVQVELQPKFFDGKEDRHTYIRNFINACFLSGGMQINMNILDLKTLENAMEHPESPEYRNLSVRVTGYSARFVALPREFQKEFIARSNYESV